MAVVAAAHGAFDLRVRGLLDQQPRCLAHDAPASISSPLNTVSSRLGIASLAGTFFIGRLDRQARSASL